MRNELTAVRRFFLAALFLGSLVAVNCAVRPPDMRRPTDQPPGSPDNPKSEKVQNGSPPDRRVEAPGAYGRTAPAWGNAPDFTLDRFGGGSLTLSDHLGRVIILDFWATWCPPCRQEIPDFIRLQKDLGPQGLIVIGVSLDRGAETAVKPFADEVGINYPVVYGFDHPEVSDDYGGITGIPTTFIIDQKGDIVGKYVGYQSRPVFEAKARQLLGLIQEEKP